MPDNHAIAVLLLTVFALFLFSRERIPLATSCLLILAALAVGFEVFPYETAEGVVRPVDFFYGFGHEALVAVCALMVMGQGLVRTGALEPLGFGLAKLWGRRPMLSLLLTLLLSALLSAFINNVPIVVLLIPVLLNVAGRTNNSPAGLLMPMGFATLLGGMGTTIGTSTNLLVVSVASEMGMSTFEMFDFALPAAIAGSIGLAFLWLVAPRILPSHQVDASHNINRIYTAHLHIPGGSFADGKPVQEAIAKTDGEMRISLIRRDTHEGLVPLPDTIIHAHDRLLVHDTPERLKRFEQLLGAGLHPVDPEFAGREFIMEGKQQLAEILIHQRSPLLGQSLQSAGFVDRYRLVALGVHRDGHIIQSMPHGLGNLKLQLGDILLVQGSSERINNLEFMEDFFVLAGKTDLPHSKKIPLALLIMFLVILLAALKILPIAISATAGVLLMIVTRCIDWKDVGQGLNLPVIMIVASSLALGHALTVTGGSEFLAAQFLKLAAGAPPPVIISGLILLMAILTNVVSNNAAAVIGTPIAINIANELQLSPEAFVIAVLFGANMSYMTPMAYKTNLLIMAAGNYQFMDFVRVGLPLTLIMWLAYSLLLPLFYYLP
ncbi:SLC13 family permease [Candidatus Thiothrix sp. Deng01]|uniref:SLC13 family permease n=1 Tax=Candidatus Thiothrix phosphatis TaxID=3112415 RepID=A0ABU6CXZ1_9GAMM|nr:SLC13 family permease [Candidatus Thiothrix sp. Deng01]MEB4591702.1 SLC13 family permease [Candidatus Thiothrix sp. Deng01]